jgi:hypothetical protein
VQQLAAGASGTPGNGSTTTTASENIVAVNSTITFPVVDGLAFPNLTYVVVSNNATPLRAIYGQVTSGGLTGSLVVTVLAILSGSVGNAIASGSTVTFAGPAGPSGSAGAGPTTTNATFSNTLNATVSNLSVVNGTAFPNGTPVVVSDGTHACAATITSGGTTNSLTFVINQILLGSSGQTMGSGATITFGAAASAYPVGATIGPTRVQFTGSYSGTVATLLATGVLGTGTWNVWATASGWGLNSQSATATFTGSGITNGAGWDAAQSVNGQSSDRYFLHFGQAAAGDNPAVTLTSTGPMLRDGSSYGLILIWATRKS